MTENNKVGEAFAPFVLAAGIGLSNPAAAAQDSPPLAPMADQTNTHQICQDVSSRVFPLLQTLHPVLSEALGVMDKSLQILPEREEKGKKLPPTCKYEFNVKAGQDPTNGVQSATLSFPVNAEKGTITADVNNPRQGQKGEIFKYKYQLEKPENSGDPSYYQAHQTGWSLKLPSR